MRVKLQPVKIPHLRISTLKRNFPVRNCQEHRGLAQASSPTWRSPCPPSSPRHGYHLRWSVEWINRSRAHSGPRSFTKAHRTGSLAARTTQGFSPCALEADLSGGRNPEFSLLRRLVTGEQEGLGVGVLFLPKQSAPVVWTLYFAHAQNTMHGSSTRQKWAATGCPA